MQLLAALMRKQGGHPGLHLKGVHKRQIVSVNLDLFVKDSQIKQKLNLSELARTFPTNIYWRLTTAIANNEDIYLAPVLLDRNKRFLHFRIERLV